MEKKALFLKLLGFTESEIDAFSAVLTLSESHLNRTWRLAKDDGVKADFFVLTERADPELVILTPNLTVHNCIRCDEFPNDDPLHILCNENFIPRIGSVIRTLNLLSDRLDAPKPALAAIVTAAGPKTALVNTGSYLDPEQGLFLHLLQPKSEGTELTLKSPNDSVKIYLYPDKSAYFCKSDLKTLGGYFNDGTEFLSADLPLSQLNTVIKDTALPQKPVSDLIWYAAFLLSQGRLLKGHSNKDIVYLTNWPNLEIPGSQKYVRLAAFMQNNAVCLEVAAHKTAIPIENVYSFYNACCLVGLVEKAEKTELHEKSLTENEKNLLSAIAARIKEFKQK